MITNLNIVGISKNVKGVILSGSPYSVNEPEAPTIDLSVLRKKNPLLALCYGAQLIAHESGGKVSESETREYGRSNLSIISQNKLFDKVKNQSQVWMSHGDTILELPKFMTVMASTDDVYVGDDSFSTKTTYSQTLDNKNMTVTQRQVVFRRGSVVCNVSVTSYGGEPPKVSDLEFIANNQDTLIEQAVRN